jgi:carbamoyltransferase
MAPRLHALLEAYGRRTGIPVLLNTSFNVAGEPMVNRALEAYSTFRRCGIDALVAGPTLVTKPVAVPVAAAWKRTFQGRQLSEDS